MGEGVIPTESRMREIRTSGSTGRGWKRTYGSRTWHRRESKTEEIYTVPLRAPRHLLTLPRHLEVPLKKNERCGAVSHTTAMVGPGFTLPPTEMAERILDWQESRGVR